METTGIKNQILQKLKKSIIHLGLAIIFLLLALTRFWLEIPLFFNNTLQKLSERLEDAMKCNDETSESLKSNPLKCPSSAASEKEMIDMGTRSTPTTTLSVASTETEDDSSKSDYNFDTTLEYPVYPVRDLTVYEKHWWADGKYINTNNGISKLWLFDKLEIRETSISAFIPNVWKNEIKDLHLQEAKMTFEEYKLITSSTFLTRVGIQYCTIEYSDGEIVTVDKLLKPLSNTEDIWMWGFEEEMFQRDTVKKMVKILPRLKKLRRFSLETIPDSFDFKSITDFLMKNESVDICLEFGVSDAYEIMLQDFINKIMANPPKKVPFIFNHKLDVNEHDQKKFAKYLKLITDKKFKKNGKFMLSLWSNNV